MKYLLLTLALLSAAPVFTTAQYLNQIYDHNSSGDWGVSVFADSSSYLIIGNGKLARWEAFTKRIDTSGVELLNKTTLQFGAYTVSVANPGKVRRAMDGSYIYPVVLSRNVGTSILSFTALVKSNVNGDTIWARMLTDSLQPFRNEFPTDGNLMPDGGAIVTIRDGGLTTSNGLLIRTDSHGSVLWKKSNSLSNGFLTCEFIGNGKILVGGGKTQLKWIGLFSYYPSQPRFCLYDTLGNLLKDTLYSKKFGGGGKIYKDRNGGYFHWGYLDSLLYPNDPSNINNFPEYVAHLDDSFKIVWIKDFATSKLDKRYILNVKQLRDNNYLIVGQQADTAFTNKGDPGGQGWAMKLDKNGFVIWDNHYYNDPATHFHYLVDAAERPDGSIVMTGSVGATSQHTQELWVVVVDSMGCIIPNCAPTTVPKLQAKNVALTVFPNPTSGVVNVKSESNGILTLTNIQGVVVLTDYTVNRGITELHLPKSISAGIYVLRYVSDDGREIGSFRLVYQP